MLLPLQLQQEGRLFIAVELRLLLNFSLSAHIQYCCYLQQANANEGRSLYIRYLIVFSYLGKTPDFAIAFECDSSCFA